MKRKNLYLRTTCLLLLLASVLGIKAQSNGLEYWFDSYSDSKTISMPVAAGTLKSSIDVSALSQGFHTIYMRVKSSDGTYSPITSSAFINFTASGDSKIEYWFDDNISKLATIPIDFTSDSVQVLNLDMTNEVNFPLGFHQLYMRVVADGGRYSPIYSAFVMKSPFGQTSEITYWLDNNYSGRRVIKGNIVNATTTVYNTSLDFSSASSGMHRLKYRITSKGFDNGVIYEVPVLITRKYNGMGDVTIIGESNWLDDICPQENSVSNPSHIFTKSYTLDPAAFSVGQHAFYVQYKNSADVWSEQNVTYFYKEASGMLRAGKIDTKVDESEDVEDYYEISYNRGMIFVDCQSSKLASTGIVTVCDLSGKVIAEEEVSNSNGIHAEVSVQGRAKQILIVRFVSGGVHLYKKLAIN